MPCSSSGQASRSDSAPVARWLAETEFQPCADPRHVPGQRLAREHASQSFRQVGGGLVHALVVSWGHQLVEAGLKTGQRQRIGRQRGAHARVPAGAILLHAPHAGLDLGW